MRSIHRADTHALLGIKVVVGFAPAHVLDKEPRSHQSIQHFRQAIVRNSGQSSQIAQLHAPSNRRERLESGNARASRFFSCPATRSASFSGIEESSGAERSASSSTSACRSPRANSGLPQDLAASQLTSAAGGASPRADSARIAEPPGVEGSQLQPTQSAVLLQLQNHVVRDRVLAELEGPRRNKDEHARVGQISRQIPERRP
jgi:hypothetical protein